MHDHDLHSLHDFMTAIMLGGLTSPGEAADETDAMAARWVVRVAAGVRPSGSCLGSALAKTRCVESVNLKRFCRFTITRGLLMPLAAGQRPDAVAAAAPGAVQPLRPLQSAEGHDAREEGQGA